MSDMTKKALAQSLKKLMSNTPLAKITVNDIVKDCEVNRRTFYYHFQDVYALLEWIYKNDIAKVMEANKTSTTWQEGFLRIFHYLSENRKLVLNTYRSISRDKLETQLYGAVYILVLNVVDEITMGMEVPKKEKEFVVNFYKVALVGLLLEWISKGMTEEPEPIIECLNKVIMGNTYKALLADKMPK